MPFKLFYDREQVVQLVRFGSVINRDTLTAMRVAAKRFVERSGPCRAIVDFSGVETVDVSSNFITDLARGGSVIGGERRVMVAPKPEIFGLSRMYELQQSDRDDEIVVVQTLEEAEKALGLHSPNFEPVDPKG
jgi:hypothetical protein